MCKGFKLAPSLIEGGWKGEPEKTQLVIWEARYGWNEKIWAPAVVMDNFPIQTKGQLATRDVLLAVYNIPPLAHGSIGSVYMHLHP